MSLRDVIAVALGHGRTMPFDFEDADAILATPEMQAIREALRLSYGYCTNGGPALDRQAMADDELPDTVIEWVMS